MQVQQQVHDVEPDRYVQHGRGLIGQQQRGPGGQGTGDAHPLALPAGELVGVAASGSPAGGTRPTSVSSWLTAWGWASLGTIPKVMQGPRHVVPDLVQGVERGVGVLEDHLHVATVLAQARGWAYRWHRLAVNDHLPAVGLSRNATVRAKVVLPEPDSPTRPSTSPWPPRGRHRSRPWTIFALPNLPTE